MLDRFTTIVKRWKERANRDPCHSEYRLILADEGFNVLKDNCDGPIASVKWHDIRSIRTYKVDVFAYDIICLAFEPEEGSWVEIDEQMDGFDAVRAKMEARFPDIPPTWFSDVMIPAFATNDTLLHPYDDESYRRQVAEQQAAQPPSKPDSLSRWDALSAICGAVASALLYGSGHPILLAGAITCTVLILVGGIAIRRIYDVHEPGEWFVELMARHMPPETRQATVDSLRERSCARAVPLWLRVSYLIVQLSAILLLIIGFLADQQISGRG